MTERRFGISLKPLSKAGTPQRTQTFAWFIFLKKILLSKQNLAYNITRTRHFGSIIHILSWGNTALPVRHIHHSHHDRHPRLVPHDQREYITHGTRWGGCRTLSNCCCHPSSSSSGLRHTPHVVKAGRRDWYFQVLCLQKAYEICLWRVVVTCLDVFQCYQL